MTTPAPEVRDAPERSRWEAVLDGQVIGVADYRVDGDVVVFPHVEVDPAHEGRGVAAQLTRAALDDVRARGRRAVPICPYVVAYVRRHPEYQDVVAADY